MRYPKIIIIIFVPAVVNLATCSLTWWEALQVYSRLANLRYDEGYASYLEVLDAERSLFNVELEYSETYANLFQALVALTDRLACRPDDRVFAGRTLAKHLQ